jgi:pimeloyl-ACP methyl ester carboxylesterase
MAVQSAPDRFLACVGTGQLVNVVESEREGRLETLRRARAAGRADAVAEIEAIGAPPYDDINKMVVERKWAGVFDTPSDAEFDKTWRNPADFTAEQNAERYKAWIFSNLIMFGQKRQDGPLMKVDFLASARRFRIPMIFIQGADDHITPTSLVARYENEIVAPSKQLLILPGGGHNAVITMPDKFLAAMEAGLGPLAVTRD